MKQLSKLLCSFDSHFPEISDDHKNNYATVDSLGSKIAPVAAVCLYSFTYYNLLLLSWLNVTTLVWKKTGNNPDPSLLRGYATVEPLSISKLNDFIIAAPQEIEFVRTGRVTGIKMDKDWCYVSFSRYQMEMSIADDMDEGLFVAFDGEMKKLHNMRAYEAGHLMAGEGVNLEETQPPPFIADIVGKTYSFQVRKIDELTSKVDQLLKNNKGHVFSIEQATAGQIQNQNQRQSQSNRQAVPATGNSQPDELKGLGMSNMFTELNAKYDTLTIHIRKIDVQLAQTVESVKMQQGTLPGKIDKNPRTEHCNAIEQPFAETVLGAEENTQQSGSSGETGPREPAETLPVRVYVPMVPNPIPSKHLMDPISTEQLAGFRKMVRRFPQKISIEHAWEIRPLHMFFKNCRESQEEIKALFTEAMTPSLKVLLKVDDPKKFIFRCSIAGVEFKETLCDSGSSVNLVSKAIVDELGIVDVEPSRLEIVPKKELCKKGEIKEVLDGDPHTDTKKLSGNVKLNEKVQKKRVKADPMMTLIPRLCDEKSIECMTSRHTRRNAQGELVTLTNQELARLERSNRQQSRLTDTTMGDHANQDDLTAAMAHMQQQMQQLQQTIQAQEQAAQQQQEHQAQTKEESDCSKKGNSSDTRKIDGLTTKVDQLLKNNQGHVFSMEQATAEQIQNQNQRQSQSNRQAVPATENNQPDELKGLGMMMQQLLQGQQVQAKALNQVTTEIDTRIGNMFTKLNAKYDTLAIHIRKIDVQLAQTVESVKRQQWTLPGKIDKNPRTEHLVSGEQLEIVPKKELCKKGEIKEVLDGDPHTDTKKLSGNVKLNEKVQKKRVKADPMMTLIPRLCDEKSIEYEVKCKGTLNLSLNSE
ncbi:hypothetical protein F2Q69_00008850 [Brassica cretica]|uniref:Uncharacterized protein n=1 Tax=Brassica cretica TaxID=69181 RepID=A0A8S9P927_BRACR|nr:hypothetical protein F2Q69_00008850 [Brassica cretica]